MSIALPPKFAPVAFYDGPLPPGRWIKTGLGQISDVERGGQAISQIWQTPEPGITLIRTVIRGPNDPLRDSMSCPGIGFAVDLTHAARWLVDEVNARVVDRMEREDWGSCRRGSA